MVAGDATAAIVTVALGLLVKDDRWVDVTPTKPQITIAPLPGRGLAVALSLRF